MNKVYLAIQVYAVVVVVAKGKIFRSIMGLGLQLQKVTGVVRLNLIQRDRKSIILFKIKYEMHLFIL